MKLKIGEMAQLFGVSTDAIRYYEKEGLIAPDKDPSSGYRFYTFKQFEVLYFILFLRSLGVSIERIRLLAAEPSADAIQTLLRERDLHLSEEIARQTQLRTRVRHHLERIRQIENGTPPSIVPSPCFVATRYPEKKTYTKTEVMQIAAQFQHIEYEQSDSSFFLNRVNDQWEITDWGYTTTCASTTQAQSFIQTPYSLRGFQFADMNATRQQISDIVVQYEAEGFRFRDQCVVVESFFIGEGTTAKSMNEFYVPVISHP
ncbi:MAG: MerR family transcriptional regulator [Bacilli bacterium]